MPGGNCIIDLIFKEAVKKIESQTSAWQRRREIGEIGE
jgi:hypothetical protein